MRLGALLSTGASAREIEAEMRSVFGDESGALSEVLKASSEAEVYAGRFRGQDAVFKRLLTADAAEKLQETEAELDYLTEAFPDGPVRAVPFLGALPETGTLVLGRAPGQRVSLALKSGDREERSRVMALCGDWLAAVAPLREETRPFWSRKMAQRLAADVGDFQEVRGILARVEALGERHRRAPLTHAVAHGDFAPVNLSVDGGTIWAYDIQGGHVLPLARMAARFLVAACLYWPGEAGILGLDDEDLAAFDISRILPPEERDEIFSFFVAEQMLRRVVSENRQGEAREVAMRRLQALHDQLPPVGGVS